jgi:hypothetical protein
MVVDDMVDKQDKLFEVEDRYFIIEIISILAVNYF